MPITGIGAAIARARRANGESNEKWQNLPLLDERNPPEATEEQRELRRALREMRKKARLAESLIETNRKLREQLAKKPNTTGRNCNLHEPNDVIRNQVLTLAGIGMPKAEIAKFIGVSVMTLAKHYEFELTQGRIGANAAVLETFHGIATDKRHPQAVAAGKKWLESNVEGWKPVTKIEHSKDPADGPPIIDSRKLNPEERAQLRALMEKMTAPDVEALPAAGLAGGVVSEQYVEDEGEREEDAA